MSRVQVAVKQKSKFSPAVVLSGMITAGAIAIAGMAKSDGHDPVTISHGYSFFGELKYAADFPHLNYVNPNAPKGGEISQWDNGTFDSFNRFARKGNSDALAHIPYESILTKAADDVSASYCLLCTTMEYPESKDWVIFNLRDDVTFSDGSPMTAADVEFTFNLFMEQGLPSYRAAFSGMVSKVEVIDSYKIKFTFTEDAPRREVVELAGGTVVFSKAWFEETGARLDESGLTPFLGTGPYAIESYDINQRVVYARQKDYWGEDIPINIGRNNFDAIRVEYFADSAAAFEGFKAGAYTFRAENSSKQWATSYDFPGIQNGTIVKAELPDGDITSGQSYVFNLRKPKFQDIRVREALGLMFNFEWSNNQLFYGLYERINSFWDNSDLAAVGAPSSAELAVLTPLVEGGLLPASILEDDVVNAATSGDRQLDRRNLRAASRLLDDAGWLVNAEGLREKDGVVLSVEVLAYSPAFDRVNNPLVENMKALGVDAKLNRVDTAQYVERLRAYDFDVSNHRFVMSFEPSTGLEQYFGSKAMESSSRNLMGFSDPAVDQLIETIVRAETEAQMQVGVRVLDRVLRSKRFWIPQWFKDVHTVAYYDQYEYPDPLPPLLRGELDFWWYNADKGAALKEAGALN